MLNTILLLCNCEINTSYNVTDIMEECSPDNTLVITDCEEDISRFGISDFALLFVCNEDKFISGAKYITDSLEECDDDYFNLVFARQKKIPLTILCTQRTIVREMTVSDLEELYVIYDDELVRKYLEPLYEYEEEKLFTEKYIENMYGLYGYGLWIVEDIRTGNIIGRIGISIRNINGKDCNELGYVIRREYRNQGYAGEVCRAILNYAAEILGMQEMYVITESDNLYSERLAISLGFDMLSEMSDEKTSLKIFLKKFKKVLDF